MAAVRAALDAGPVVVLTGRTGLTEDPQLGVAVAAFAASLPDAALMPLARRGNVYGALDMGLAPGLLPGRVPLDDAAGRAALEEAWGGPVPSAAGRDAAGILEGLAAGDLAALLLLGADPVADFPANDLASRALDSAGFVVAFDLFLTDSSRYADVVLPVAGFTEVEGTMTNLEGRVQKSNRLVPAPGQARPAWSVIEDLAVRLGGSIGAASGEGLAKEIATVAPCYAGVTWDALDWGTGREGIVVPGPEGSQPLSYQAADPGFDGTDAEFALHLARVLYDDGVHIRFGPSLGKLVGVVAVHLNPDDAVRLGLASGDMVRVTSAGGGEVEMPLALDPSLAPGTVYVPFNLDGSSVLAGAVEVHLEAAT
jgi:predicted molibdopterin-dependent oxidoreductase YjgC